MANNEDGKNKHGMNRRNFLGLLATGAGLSGTAVLVNKYSSTDASLPPATQVPPNFDDIAKLDLRTRALFAAACAYGDAAAYYDTNKKLLARVNLYPETHAADSFGATLGADNTELRHIQVPGGGTVVLHTSANHLDREQPEYSREAKFRMAKLIVKENSEQLLFPRKAPSVRTNQKRNVYFRSLIKEVFSSFIRTNPKNDPTEQPDVKKALANGTVNELLTALRRVEKADFNKSDQSHLLGVAELMKEAVEVMNKDGLKVDDMQRERLILGGLLHDLGKMAVPAQLLSAWPAPTGPDKNTKMQELQEFFASRNGNHGLFSYMMLEPTDPWDAMAVGLHHHGARRYGDIEIEMMKTPGMKDGEPIPERIRKQFKGFSLLKHDIASEKLSQMARLARVMDVFNAIEDRVNLSLPATVAQLGGEWSKKNMFNKIIYTIDEKGEKQGTAITPDSMDGRAVCYAIAHGMFHAYADVRSKTDPKWNTKDCRDRDAEKKPYKKYDEVRLRQAENVVLDRFGWGKINDNGQMEYKPKGQWECDEINRKLREEMNRSRSHAAAPARGAR